MHICRTIAVSSILDVPNFIKCNYLMKLYLQEQGFTYLKILNRTTRYRLQSDLFEELLRERHPKKTLNH
ncbi:ASN_HP2_G0015500.mRNA.1.CDS.1 [Saccharomyces cerevisiae]|nr:ASN_HP2_G0015500.mRNA.1.CDS.1 [Saccharomyces cerevisiae]CAI6556598.1 ASN_HP2_G0015500.mRNA.1.CDS.1 [Saccharomyces cerevisiae]